MNELPSALIREGMMLLFATGGPIFFGLLLMGVFVGILQAATQINDPAFSFLPRILTAGALLWVSGGFIAKSYADYFVRAAHSLGGSVGG